MKAEGGRWKAEGSRTDSRDLTDRRSAMTLFVLALLVIVGSLAAPLYEGSFSSIRLRRGADQILATWSEARTHAIESGQIYQFRFKPEESAYRVDPWSGGLEPSTLKTESLLVDTTNTNEKTAEEIELANWKYETQLPEKIVFDTAESVSEDELGQRRLTRLDQDSMTEWSAPILFFPDGTTSEASLLLKSSKGLYRRATLRALTGVGRASDLLSREEVDRYKTQ